MGHPSIDLPLVALIIKVGPFNLKRSTAKCVKVSSSTQNPLKKTFNIISKTFQNRSKTRIKVPNAFQTHPETVFFSIFSNFLKPQSLPKSSQNRKNPKKNVPKS